MQTTFIYSLVCPTSDEIKYIGKSGDIKRRLRQHIYQSKYSDGKKNKWIRDLLSENLKPKIEILDEVPYEEWGYWEDYWIQQSKNWGFVLLNKMDGGHGYGKHSEETLDKISKSLSGKNNPMYGKPGTKGMLGKTLTAEQKRKISKSKKGKHVGEKNPGSKLTKDNVIEIRVLLSENKSPYKIAKQFKVHPQSIYNIKDGKTWVTV